MDEDLAFGTTYTAGPDSKAASQSRRDQCAIFSSARRDQRSTRRHDVAHRSESLSTAVLTKRLRGGNT
jgi:hypothetical protein